MEGIYTTFEFFFNCKSDVHHAFRNCLISILCFSYCPALHCSSRAAAAHLQQERPHFVHSMYMASRNWHLA